MQSIWVNAAIIMAFLGGNASAIAFMKGEKLAPLYVFATAIACAMLVTELGG